MRQRTEPTLGFGVIQSAQPGRKTEGFGSRTAHRARMRAMDNAGKRNTFKVRDDYDGGSKKYFMETPPTAFKHPKPFIIRLPKKMDHRYIPSIHEWHEQNLLAVADRPTQNPLKTGRPYLNRPVTATQPRRRPSSKLSARCKGHS